GQAGGHHGARRARADDDVIGGWRHLPEKRPERIFAILPSRVRYMLMLSTTRTSPFIVGHSSKSGQSLMVVNVVRLCSAAPFGATMSALISSASAMCSNTPA